MLSLDRFPSPAYDLGAQSAYRRLARRRGGARVLDRSIPAVIELLDEGGLDHDRELGQVQDFQHRHLLQGAHEANHQTHHGRRLW